MSMEGGGVARVRGGASGWVWQRFSHRCHLVLGTDPHGGRARKGGGDIVTQHSLFHILLYSLQCASSQLVPTTVGSKQGRTVILILQKRETEATEGN